MKKGNGEDQINQSDNFSGVLVTLKKRMQKIKRINCDCFGYTVFGHYDGLEICCIDKWIDFLPIAVEKNKAKLNLEDNILDLYTLRACAPNNKSALEQMGFRYDIWGDEIEYNRNSGKFPLLYPLVACSLLHLRRECIANTDLNTIINEIAKKLKEHVDLTELNCGLFFSIGYSDIILLFRVNDFEYVDRALSYLNKSEIKNSKIISDSYTITGFSNKVFSNFGEVKNALLTYPQDDKNFAVAFSLHENINVDEFANCLKAEVRNLCNKISYGYVEGKTVGRVFSVFGNADAVVELNMPIYVYMSLYMTESDYTGPFCIMHNLHRIATIQSTAMIPVPTDVNMLPKNIISNDINMNIIIKFKSQVETFCDFTKIHGITHRNVVAIKQLIKLFENLIFSNHGFEIKNIIGDAFEAFFVNLSICMINIDRKYREFSNVESDVENNIGFKKRSEYVNEIKKMLRAIEIFRDYIGTYLSDLSRSDRSFIEGRAIKHPSIGSLTKLLFAYNQYINQLVYDIEKENSKNYAFVVVSGGCDTTKVHEMFSHINNQKDYKHLYIITLPEICLFDFKGTLLELSHECFHCIGDKYRDKRYEFLVRAGGNYIADVISSVIVNHIAPDANRVSRDNAYVINRYINKCIKSLRIDLSDTLWEYNQVMVKNHLSNIDEQIRFQRSIEYANQIFDFNMLESNDYLENRKVCFFDNACMAVYDTFVKLYESLVENENICSTEKKIKIRDMLSEVSFYKKNRVEPEKVQNAYKVALKKIFIALHSPKELYNLEKYEEFLLKTINSKTDKIGSYDIISYEKMTQYIMGAMCESFADCMAIRTLNADLSDFLLCFVYQTCNIDRAFPYNMETIFRIGVDLKLMYGIGDKLDVKYQEEIKKRFNDYANNKLISYSKKRENNPINADMLIERINDIVLDYKERYFYAQYIEEYINTCIDDVQSNNKYSNINSIYKINNDSVFNFMNLWRVFAQKDTRE